MGVVNQDHCNVKEESGMAKDQPANDESGKEVFRFFNELFIIQQLASTVFNQSMPDGLHVSHFAVINHLVRVGDCRTPLQIASAMQVTKPTMTHTVNVLVGHGLVEIFPNGDDGRSKLVCLTDEGKRFQQTAIKALAPTYEKIVAEVGIDALSESLPLLEKLRIYLDQNRKT